MIGSYAISVVFFVMRKTGHALPFAHTVLYSVALTTICWLVAAYLTPPTSRERLISFYRKVHPSGPGWRVIREAAGVDPGGGGPDSGRIGPATPRLGAG